MRMTIEAAAPNVERRAQQRDIVLVPVREPLAPRIVEGGPFTAGTALTLVGRSLMLLRRAD